MNTELTERKYAIARERYAAMGVDTDRALERLQKLPISLHCWQTDDVKGFENPDGTLSGGIQATGNYPGRARSLEQVRQDVAKVVSMIGGRHRLSLHAIYGDFGGCRVDRNAIEPAHFRSWIEWARETGLQLDFNSTSFSHPLSGDQTLSHPDPSIRQFWIEHTVRSRRIAQAMGEAQETDACHNLWVHDGSKDLHVDKYATRARLKESLDEIFACECPRVKDALESKLFGTGLESFTAGSHEFYLGYALLHGQMVTLDMGHFHPTEEIADKISALLLYVPELLLHVSRPVRWDSDHVVILNDSVQMLAEEVVWADALDRVHVGLDYFDASINRIGAYVIGLRATQKAFLKAFLSPIERLRGHELSGRFFERLALLEECKSMPWGDVYDYFCLKNGVPVGEEYISEIERYEREVTAKR